jgi:hypothetical protein
VASSPVPPKEGVAYKQGKGGAKGTAPQLVGVRE